MTKRFDRVLSEQELIDIFESMGFGGGHGTFLDIANEVQQAVLEKLPEQEPVAWTSSKISGHYVTHDAKATAAEWFKENLDVPLYAHPMPNQARIKEALRFAAQVIELYDDATLVSDNYMLTSTDCAEIIKELVDYIPCVSPTSDDNSLTIAYMSGYHDGKRSTTPDGWQLVPIEPTEEMHHAARDWSIEKYGKAIGFEASHGCYKAMLAAARGIKE